MNEQEYAAGEAVEAAVKAIMEATEAWERPLWGEDAETVARAALEAMMEAGA